MIPSVSVTVSVNTYESLNKGTQESYWVSWGITAGEHKHVQFEAHHFYNIDHVWGFIYDCIDDWSRYRIYDRPIEAIKDLYAYRRHGIDPCGLYGCHF